MQCRACGCILAAILAVCLVTACTGKQLQEQDSWKVLLPKGSQPEGISSGADNDIWVACLSGSIIHVDLAKNSSTVVYKERNVHLSGVKFCKKQQLLFVSGTLSGKAYLYHMQRTAGAAGPTYSVSKREVLDLNLPGKGYINDVALSQDKAYFTDSFNPVLYQVPRYFGTNPSNQQRFSLNIIGSHNKEAPRPITRVNTGSYFDTKVGQFRANGIAVYKTTEVSDILLVANTHTGHLYKVVVYKTEQAQPAAGPAAPSAPTGGAQQAVANMAQQATMAVASRLRLGRPTDTSDSSSADSSSSDSESSADGVPAGLMAAAKAAAATAEEEGMEVDQALAQLDESPTLLTPQVAKNASSSATKSAQPQPQAKAKDTKDTKAIKQAKAAGAAGAAGAAAAKHGSKSQHKPHSKPKAAAAGAAAAAVSTAPTASTGKAQGKQPSKQDTKWDKLAKDVADLSANKQPKAAQQKQGRKLAPAAAAAAAAGQPAEAQQTMPVPATQAVQVTGVSLEDAAAAAVQAVQVGSYLTKLAGNVRSRMRMSRKQQQQQLDAQLQDMPDSASSTVVSAASSAPSAAKQRGHFTARPSADAFVKAGKGTKRNERGKKQQHTAAAAAAAADPVLLAEPVPITEPKVDINAAVLAEAATQAAYAAAAAHHQRALGRILLAAADADSARFSWPSQMARGIVEKLGFSGRHKQVTADVEELQLPSIPGQYTKRLLVDGIAVKNDTAYVADNYNDRVWGLQLGKGLSDVKVSCVIQGPIMHVPTTLTFVGGRLWWVNAHLDTCFPFLPCPTHKFELYGVNPGMCQPWTG